MQNLFRRILLLCPLAGAVLSTTCLGAQSLPDGWWLQDSPGNILVKAQSINQQLSFFQAAKSGPTASSITNPFAKTNANERMDFFQRRNSDGFVETKEVKIDGNFQWTDYKLKSGHYFLMYGQVIKAEFAEGDEIEKTIATNFDLPYEFKLLKSELVGTNDCIVIARCMTPKFLDAMKAVLYKNYTKEQEAAFGGDFREFIRSETDYYFRKTDGISFGLARRNHLGEQLENMIYDNATVSEPIPDQEFFLPKGDIKIAKSSEECQNILGQLRATKLAKSRNKPTAKLSDKRLSELPWATTLPKAMEQATAENKMVLLDFTGSDWCVWCIKFEEDVLSKPEFASYAKTNLVMVLVDFPNAKPQSDAVKKANAELQTQFKVDGFPTFVALAPDGKEIGRQAGYLSGGPQAFISKLNELSQR